MSGCGCGKSSGKGGSAISKYGGGGDSSRGYERAGQFRSFLYPSDLSLSPFDRYALARKPQPSGQPYKPVSPLERYTPPKPAHQSDVPFGMDAYRPNEALDNPPMLRPPFAFDELDELEKRRKRLQN